MKRILVCMVVLALMLALTSCLASVNDASAEPAGFFLGIWHGWVAPIALVGRLFYPDLRIYAPNNTGWWYEFGFYIAIIGGFGTISLARSKRHHKD